MAKGNNKLSNDILKRTLIHNGTEMSVQLCIQLAENAGSDTEMYPYLASLLFFAIGSKSTELLRECERLKTIHGGKPFSMPVSSRGSSMPVPDLEVQQSFVDRVKTIITKAAEKNGTKIEANDRGRAYTYLFNIDAERFCKALDRFVKVHEAMLMTYLSDDLNNINISVVAKFIGRVLDMEIINNQTLLRKDIIFAFKDYYKNDTTIKNKLSDKQLDDNQRLLFSTFEGFLKTQKS